MLRMSRLRTSAARLRLLPFCRCFTGVSPGVLDAGADGRRPDPDAALRELVTQLLQRLVAEVTEVQEVVLGHAGQLANARNAVALEAVEGAVRQLEVVDR